jgi:predicted MPP superfamily phosphohydrolase
MILRRLKTLLMIGIGWTLCMSIVIPILYFTFKQFSQQRLVHTTMKIVGRNIPFQQDVHVNYVTIPIENQYSDVLNLSFMQISDIHSDYSGESLSDKVIEQLVQKIQLVYDKNGIKLLFITGDFVHGEVSQSIQQLKQKFFDKLPKGLRIIGSLGNHDLHVNKKQVLVDYLRNQCGVTLLDNQVLQLRDSIILTGLGDYKDNGGSDFNIESVKQQFPKDIQRSYIITLSHNPLSAECLLVKNSKHGSLCEFNNRLRSNLVLSGHTHAGQIRIPFIHKPVLPILYNLLPSSIRNRLSMLINLYNAVENWEWASGLISFEDNRFMYVNRGIGSHFGLRFACHPELTVFRFQIKEK